MKSQSAKQDQFGKALIAAKHALNQAGVEFFLASGTALGAWREGKIIEYTNDIDLGYFAKEDDSLMIQAFTQNGFTLLGEFGARDDGYKVKFYHDSSHVRIDVFPYYESSDYFWSATHGRSCQCMARKFCRWRFRKFDLQEIHFLDHIFLIPHPADHYMIDKYGIDWETPKNFTHRQGIYGKYKNLIFEISFKNMLCVIWAEVRNRVSIS